jgi:hypothetical protein
LRSDQGCGTAKSSLISPASDDEGLGNDRTWDTRQDTNFTILLHLTVSNLPDAIATGCRLWFRRVCFLVCGVEGREPVAAYFYIIEAEGESDFNGDISNSDLLGEF